jgi:hypothetical protein
MTEDPYGRLTVKVTGLILSMLLLCSCGTASNVNQIWGGDDEGGDSMLAEAKAAYDAKDYDRAEQLSRKLLNRNPDNEEAAIMLGYTMLSRGGIEPIELARKLIAISGDDTTDSTTGTKLQGDASDSSSAATSTLIQLGSLINLTSDDFTNLADKSFDAEANGGTEPSLFATDTNPLLIPAKVSDALRAKVPVLGYMNSAVSAICRFVDTDAKVAEEPRHQAAGCAQTSVKRRKAAKSHFLWAFSHLVEALVYQSVILYSSVDGVSSNFQVASDTINNKNYGTDISQFVNDVTEMKNAVDLVFDTASTDSMITATLLNLDTVNKAFSAIAGLPSGITDKISQSLNQINSVSEKLGQTGVQGNTSALKGQMTEKFATVVGEKITTVASTNPALQGKTYTQIQQSGAPAELVTQVGSMCKSYDTLAKGLPPEKNKKPTTCTGAPTN